MYCILWTEQSNKNKTRHLFSDSTGVFFVSNINLVVIKKISIKVVCFLCTIVKLTKLLVGSKRYLIILKESEINWTMELRIGIEKYDTNKYSLKTIEYIKGILHTYAELNQPDSNLVFEYEIVEFEKSENVTKSLKERFYIFENQQLELNEISKNTFIDKLKTWFYTNGELSNMNFSERKQECNLNYFYQLLETILNIKQIFKIENLKSENEKVSLELGINYDYFILKSSEKNYILYFTFID